MHCKGTLSRWSTGQNILFTCSLLYAMLHSFPYADDAILVIKPGMNAVGKEQIRKVFEAIAVHFEHSLDIKQAGIKVLKTGDTL